MGLLWLSFGISGVMWASEDSTLASSLKTELTLQDFDSKAYAEWVGQKETPISGTNRESLPQWIFSTQTSRPGHSGFAFGKSREPGIRHLRIGFTHEIPVGTVIVKGGGSLSVLKSTAAYPGNQADEQDWIQAEHLVSGKASTAEVSPDQYTTWVLPPGTKTRALRFTHSASLQDPSCQGRISGVTVLADRLINVAPLAFLWSSANNPRARAIVNEKDDGWKSWENIEYTRNPSQMDSPKVPSVSPGHPETLILSWSEDVDVIGLVAIFPGFSTARAEAYEGHEKFPPKESGEGDSWKGIGSYSGINNGYPSTFSPVWLPFEQMQRTRAIRLQLTSSTAESHPHLKGKTSNGARVWLNELMVFASLGEKPLRDFSLLAGCQARPAPPESDTPIPIRFSLAQGRFVTLVIENKEGVRVRNLFSDIYFPAGEHVVSWDGCDDLLRDPDAAQHGVFHIPSRLVQPGEYRFRGIVHDVITPRFEMSFYTPGNPPWSTIDKTGAWLANHTPPQAASFAPAGKNFIGKPLVFLGSYVSEGMDGMIWVDLEGRKQGGKKVVGRSWTGAQFIACDTGEHPLEGNPVYVGSVWQVTKGSQTAELLLTAVGAESEKSVLKVDFSPRDTQNMEQEIAGLAVYDGILVVSMNPQGKLMLVDAARQQVIGSIFLPNCRGVAFDREGRLFAVAGKSVFRFDSIKKGELKSSPVEVISSALEDPQQITLDTSGHLYVSDWGSSHQVKMFAPPPPSGSVGLSPKYSFERAIGHSGSPRAGPYDSLHMNHPMGVTIDCENHLWVAEKDFLPKRVSIWTLDGSLIHAFYGPAKYGGGGTLDSRDKDTLYYAEEGRGAMAFHLDWEKGTSDLRSIFYRPDTKSIKLAFRSAAPETAIWHGGRRYFVNCYNSNPTSGHSTAFLFLEKEGIARPVAAMGRANDWEVLKEPRFRKYWPSEVDPNSPNPFRNEAFFCWSDKHGDGIVRPEDVIILKGCARGITIMPDLAFCVASFEGRSMRYPPKNISQAGVPFYDMNSSETLATGVMDPASSGGTQVLDDPSGKAVVTLGIKPFSRQSLCGTLNGIPLWSYPSLWPGLHASHSSPAQSELEELIGTTRLLGGFFDAGNPMRTPLWAVNGNLGAVYVFTADGLFVSSLFGDERSAISWKMPKAERGMSLEGVSLGGENFWPTICGTSDGGVYLVDGTHGSIVGLKGFETIMMLPEQQLTVTPSQLKQSAELITRTEAERQKQTGANSLSVPILKSSWGLDTTFASWPGSWVDIDTGGVKAFFASTSRPYDITGSLIIAGERLYAAYKTGNPKLLENRGELPMAPFKTGGALDLMIGADPVADPERKSAVPGDSRLLVTRVGGKIKAILYRSVVPGTPDRAKVPFSSPWRTITIDEVKDVSRQIQLRSTEGNYEFSVPLDLLGLKPEAGLRIKGDLGILRGESGQTTARIYWNNKSSGLTSDVPSEAVLTPALWGTLLFKQEGTSTPP